MFFTVHLDMCHLLAQSAVKVSERPRSSQKPLQHVKKISHKHARIPQGGHEETYTGLFGCTPIHPNSCDFILEYDRMQPNKHTTAAIHPYMIHPSTNHTGFSKE